MFAAAAHSSAVAPGSTNDGCGGQCSYNGECSDSGGCVCEPAWLGTRCEQLNLLLAEKGLGLNRSDAEDHVSSWGGDVLQADDGTWHMWAAEFANHCGIKEWDTNSMVRACPPPRPTAPETSSPRAPAPPRPANGARERAHSDVHQHGPSIQSPTTPTAPDRARDGHQPRRALRASRGGVAGIFAQPRCSTGVMTVNRVPTNQRAHAGHARPHAHADATHHPAITLRHLTHPFPSSS